MTRPAPPRFMRRLLRWAVPPGEAETVDGDLLELFAERVERDGRTRARWWYRRQVLGFAARSGAARRAYGQTPEGGDAMRWMEEVIRDVRWALRGLRRRPTFTVVAVATLALGIGANSAVFTLVSAHFLTPLPYGDPDALVLLWESGRNSDERTTVAPGNYFTWREQTSSLAAVAAYNVNMVSVSGDGSAERLTASVVTPDFFDVLGVSPVLGSGFHAGMTGDADTRVAVISHGLWTRRYGGDPSVVGADIRINGVPHTLVGVLPPDYRQPERSLSFQATDVWRPLDLEPRRDDFGSRYLRTIARLQPGATVEQARAEMDALAARMAELHPEENGGRRILVYTLPDYLMGDARPVLRMLLAAAAAVLLIVCANVANLTLARGQERRREFALRAALGSGRQRLTRQILVESVLLSLAGAALGTGLVLFAGDLLQVVQERFFTGLVRARVDGRVVALTTAVATAAGLLFGLPLARAAGTEDLRGTLVSGGDRAGAGRSVGSTRAILVVGQVGLATTLLVTAFLLTRSFGAMVAVEPGFEPGGLLTFDVAPPASDYADRASIETFWRELERELEATPGVASVAFISDLPFTTENRGTSLQVEGIPFDPTNPPGSEYHVAFPDYFEAMAIPLLEGRLFDGWAEPEGEVPVVVNQRLAESFWSGESAVGRTMTQDGLDPPRVLRVVGLVGDVLDDGFEAEAEPTFYLPWGASPQWGMAALVTLTRETPEVVAAVRGALARVDPDVPPSDVRMLEDLMAETVVRPRAASLIGGVFAALALLVAAAGIYGVLSYSVEMRTREIGIRAALGATGPQLVSMVMGESTSLLAVGLGVGVGAALLTGLKLSSLLFGVQAWDPPSLLLAPLLLGAVGSLAAWLPARRAVRVDPREALTSD